ncbi:MULTISPECIES: arylamine N-acetyltransferase [unclassified Cupriavidus]|uniref:arylamine N-acetyltransferase family protein n=1 Tax=unclassified Cupriavidus TaxID=2640874 RepID=UPI001C004116|nr:MULTISPECIES: arylamine N-acetyltransferase [unclassified Cupriavidus]MCA3192053.1 arylamine N-acetyltransferase [Cupriavidus sp.]MCA3197798.1 arylamine N-acetyltransferase [Cupriavidus sp.]MCA3202850.1 arylamine N-acetyltransferase [Cupriavidus sp.]MCA3206662.1 arylamine N-acetyltransferase [Cupriavidus sp.]QWE96862.1 arylamine N-acetyltransferase [Cupriavidus sp. EM10]
MQPADQIPALSADQRDAWLARIGLGAGTAPPPTLDTLNALIASHLRHIPFENLTPLVGWRVNIDLPAVFDKLVHQGRGGYCFELNTLFCAGLKALGFTVTPLAARVRWNVPDERPRGLSHMLLRVEVAHESHVADVGFGGPTPDRSLALSLPAAANSPYQLLPVPAATAGTGFHAYDLAVRNPDAAGVGNGKADDADAWRVLYRFDLTPQPQIDYVARNWYVSTHPDSHFTQMLIAARTDASGARLSLGNGSLTERMPDGTVCKTDLATANEAIDVLADRFGIRIDADLRAALAARLPALLAARQA